MSEKMPKFEHRENEPALWFSLLDIVKINGRWAQINGQLIDRGEEQGQLVHYLDDDSWTSVDFTKYELTEHLDSDVGTMLKAGKITDTEFKYIKWDGDNIGTSMSLEVIVFGEFTKK